MANKKIRFWDTEAQEPVDVRARDNGDGTYALETVTGAAPSSGCIRAAVSAATAGNNTLVAAASGKRTKVLGLLLVAAGAVNVRLDDGPGGTPLTGLISLAAEGNGFVLPMALPGSHWLETSVNTALVLNLSAAVQVSGCIVYYQEA